MSIVTKESNPELYEALFNGMPPFTKQDCEGCYEYRKLQQENKELKEQLKVPRRTIFDITHEKLVKDYKERIEKAKEELQKHITFCEEDSQGLYDVCNHSIKFEKNC